MLESFAWGWNRRGRRNYRLWEKGWHGHLAHEGHGSRLRRDATILTPDVGGTLVPVWPRPPESEGLPSFMVTSMKAEEESHTKAPGTRDRLVEEEWEAGSEETIGVITLLYDHHQRELSQKLTHSQHSHHAKTVSSLHIHLDSSNCLEVIVLRASAARVRRLADRLISTRGVKHGKLIMTSTGRQLA